MRKIIFASNNKHKAEEIRAVLGAQFDIITLKEAGIEIDIPEPHETLAENAREKSMVIHRLTGMDCFSEDTGLEVDALNGAPGVRSARYAGEQATADDNLKKLLVEMKGIEKRSARFRTVISLILNGQEHMFEGDCEGNITDNASGTAGFGYDPVFMPEQYDKTFAELGIEVKSAVSHRKKAIEKMTAFLGARENK
ncbi:MAG: RdgB/HAM1 family non-canonical purine NTP pyrophosphatase [Chitinophagaceae bacterium]|jgi:XTP/dITP diphosphohydrolase|nr:RdgB/HAM1 family non-canonical purine NTP pyrophosphatase [Chitinophagaceae bacterium]